MFGPQGATGSEGVGTISMPGPTGLIGLQGPTGSFTGPTGAAGWQGRIGPTGMTGATMTGDYMSTSPPANPILSVPPLVIGTGTATSAVTLGNRIVLYNAYFKITGFVPQSGVTGSLRASLPYTNHGTASYAIMGKYGQFMIPGGSHQIIGICAPNTDYVEFRYYDSTTGIQKVLTQDNLNSTIELAYSINYYTILS